MSRGTFRVDSVHIASVEHSSNYGQALRRLNGLKCLGVFGGAAVSLGLRA